MAEIHEIERNPEFDAYLPLFKEKVAEPTFPDFSDEWLNRAPRIQLEDTTMVASPNTNNKKKIYFSAAATLLIAVSAALFTIFRQSAPEAPAVSHTGKLKAVVVFLKGEASKVTADGSVALHSGDILGAGTKIITGPGSMVDLAFEGGAIVRLRESTDVVLATPADPGKGIYIEQSNGKTLHLVKKLDAGAQHGSISPTAVASVRGTIYEFNVESDATTVVVAEGMVEATGMKGKTETHIIEANREIRLSDNLDQPSDRKSEGLVEEAAEMQRNADAFAEASSLTGELQEAKSEEDLKRIYQQEIELITLTDGRVLRGVVVAQSGGKLLVQTVQGSHFVDENSVKNIRYATETVTQ